MELSTSTSSSYTIDGSNLILNGWDYPIESRQLYYGDRTTINTVQIPTTPTPQYVLRYDVAEGPSWHNPGRRIPKTLCRLFINGKPIEGFTIKNVEFTDAVSVSDETYYYDLNVDLELIKETIPDISIDKLLEESLEEIADEQ